MMWVQPIGPGSGVGMGKPRFQSALYTIGFLCSSAWGFVPQVRADAPLTSENTEKTTPSHTLSPVKRLGFLPIESNFSEYRQFMGENFWKEGGMASPFQSQEEFHGHLFELWKHLIESTGRFWLLPLEVGEHAPTEKSFGHFVNQTIKTKGLDTLWQTKLEFEPDQIKLQVLLYEAQDFQKENKKFVIYHEVILPYEVSQSFFDQKMDEIIAIVLKKLNHEGSVLSKNGGFVTIDVGSQRGFKVGDHLMVGQILIKKKHPLTQEVLNIQLQPKHLVELISVNVQSSVGKIVSSHQQRSSSPTSSPDLVWRPRSEWTGDGDILHKEYFESQFAQKGFYRSQKSPKPLKSQISPSQPPPDVSEPHTEEKVVLGQLTEPIETPLAPPFSPPEAGNPVLQIPGLVPKRLVVGPGMGIMHLRTAKGTQASQLQIPFLNTLTVESTHEWDAQIRIYPSLMAQLPSSKLTGTAVQLHLAGAYAFHQDSGQRLEALGVLGFHYASLQVKSKNRKADWSILGLGAGLKWAQEGLLPNIRSELSAQYHLAGPNGFDALARVFLTEHPLKNFGLGLHTHQGPEEYKFTQVSALYSINF